MSPSESTRRRGVLIVDHGTRSAEANATLSRLAELIAQRRPGWLVAHAHMELAEPDLPTAIASLVLRGAMEIHVHPHFLAAGHHVRESIPALVDVARERHPKIEIRLGEPLGEDRGLIDLVVARLDELGGRSSSGD